MSKPKVIVWLVLLLAVHFPVSAQEQVIRLWEGKAPGSEKWLQTEKVINTPKGTIIQNVVDPTLTVFLPDQAKQIQTAVIVCPGGGFRALSWDSEGVEAARWLNSKGITAFVLKYRTLNSEAQEGRPKDAKKPQIKWFNTPEEVTHANANPSPENQELSGVIDMAIADAQQALRVVCQNADKWNIDPKKIGFLGFSAGGGVAIGAALDENNRPGFVATAYGPALIDVIDPRNAPPLFMAVASGHKNVAVGCVALYSVWKNAGNSAELHLFGKGDSPFGMGNNQLPSDDWPELFYRWLKNEGF